jgi:hypothetical protein
MFMIVKVLQILGIMVFDFSNFISSEQIVHLGSFEPEQLEKVIE